MPSRRQRCILYERLCKASAEAKFTWIMQSRNQRCMNMSENLKCYFRFYRKI